MSRHLRRLLAVSDIRGALDTLERLLGDLPEAGADAIAVVGDLGAPWSKTDSYRAIFKALGEAGLPAFWVPGPTDAPLGDYLRESANIEVAYPLVRGVHGTAAIGPGNVLFAGIGGEIVDDLDAIRAEDALVRYPGWEAEYRLKIVREFDQDEQVFLFATPPAHKGLGEPGSEVLAELIKTYRPRLAIVAGEHPLEEWLGNTLVVCPGRLEEGSYAFVDLGRLTVESGVLGAKSAV